MTKIADTLLENRDKAIQYLRENNWTVTDITSQWGRNYVSDDIYGQITGNDLSNTKGVCISQYGYVCICHFNENGNATEPMIYCNADEFEIE